MYQYSITEKDTEEIKKLQNTSNDINTKFKEIDDKYDKTFNEREMTFSPPKFEKIDYVKPSEETIKNNAVNQLNDYKKESIDSINNKYITGLNNIEEKVENKGKILKAEKQELENLYGSLKNNAENEAQKRGLQRSSIIVNQLEAFDRSKLNEYVRLNEEFKGTLNELESEKEILNTEKNNALSSFDISYAIKLQDKIEKLNSEIEKKENEVLKYNNEIAEKEANYQKEYEETANKLLREDRLDRTNLLEYLSKYGTIALDELKAKEKYLIVENAFKNLSKDEIINEIKNNPNIKKQLGKYYQKLHAEYINN